MAEINEFFVLLDEEGNEVPCQTLFMFDNPETEKSYVVYTDNTCSEDGNLNIFASVFEYEGEELKLTDIETDEEWETVSQVICELMVGEDEEEIEE